MRPLIKHHRYMTELNTSPVYPETVFYLKIVRGATIVAQNDQIISIANAPIMKIVRAIRSMFPKANLQLI
jgi:hypothetical protein